MSRSQPAGIWDCVWSHRIMQARKERGRQWAAHSRRLRLGSDAQVGEVSLHTSCLSGQRERETDRQTDRLWQMQSTPRSLKREILNIRYIALSHGKISRSWYGDRTFEVPVKVKVKILRLRKGWAIFWLLRRWQFYRARNFERHC